MKIIEYTMATLMAMTYLSLLYLKHYAPIWYKRLP